MIAIDTNILVYSHREDSPHHYLAFESIKELTESNSPWAIPWPCLHEFYSIVTHPRVFDPPTPVAAAIDQVEAWLECPTLHVIGESGKHWHVLRSIVEAAQIVGPRVHDARIAAISQQHGVTELWTADRDFSAFPDLKIRNPCVRA